MHVASPAGRNRNGRESDEVALIDREAVLGFGNTPERESFYSEVAETLQPLRAAFNFQGKKVRRELDLIGIHRNTGELCLVEIKHSETSGDEIAGAPWQLLFYVSAWKRALAPETGAGLGTAINNLISCKKTLGALPVSVSLFSEKDIRLAPYLLMNQRARSEDVYDQLTVSLRAVNGYLVSRQMKPITVIGEDFQRIQAV